MKNIAIVGGGLAGSSALKELLTHPKFNKEDRITIFEAQHTLGAGMPYENDSRMIMLNVPPDVLSVEKNNSEDFVRWIDQNYEEGLNFEGLIPRPVYGEYLNEQFRPYFNHEQVKVIHDSVEDLKIKNKKLEKAKDGASDPYFYDLCTAQSGWLEESFDAVFFAIGHPPYSDYYDLIEKDNYIHNPYPAKEKLSVFDGNEKIGIIGSGAAAIDVMRYLVQTYDLKAPLTFYVRNEPFHTPLIPLARPFTNFTLSDDWITEELEKGNGLILLDRIYERVMADFSREGVDPIKVYSKYHEGKIEQYRHALEIQDQDLAYTQKYTSSMVPYLPTLLNALDQKDFEIFNDKYREPLLFLRVATPTKTFEWILELLATHQIRIVRGLDKIEPGQNQGFKVLSETEENIDYLVNATGFEQRLSEIKKVNVLIENLYRKRIILPGYDEEGILVSWPRLEVVNQRYGLLKNVFFLGGFVSSTHYPNNDAGNIMRKTSDIIQRYMDNN